ncbi:MAG TPA: hypothetical protein VJN96_24335 [Vicinamibacterales bacterium]|nr:hypothetical protein [Vicinamibacterales bacterium]
MLPYRRTQIGWPAILGVSPSIIIGVLLIVRSFPFASLVLAIGPVVILLMGWLTVSVDERELVARFGLGLIRKRILLSDAHEYRAVVNPWYYGWGIRWIPGGWVYNVAGFEAVDFTLGDGRHVRVGTPEPQALCQAIDARIGSNVAAGADGSASAAPPSWAFVPPIIIAAAVAIVIGLVLWTGARPIEASVGSEAFVVTGAGYSVRVPFGAIRDVSLIDELPPIVHKRDGFAAGGKLRGEFTVAGIGPAQVFVDRDVPPFVVVKTTNGVLIVNGVNADTTRRLRDDLARAAGR